METSQESHYLAMLIGSAILHLLTIFYLSPNREDEVREMFIQRTAKGKR
jgi:hypothetical protein